jgi:flagellar biosynthesis/type III secretory pathway M-ring protein FliF/YscJ
MAAEQTVVVQAAPVITDTVIIVALAIIGIFIVYLMLREVRLMKTTNRKIEMELEKDKLKLLQQHADSKNFPFTRLSPEQTAEIKAVEDENLSLETGIFAKEKLVETRLTRLENYVKTRKLDNMMGKISEEEKKVK